MKPEILKKITKKKCEKYLLNDYPIKKDIKLIKKINYLYSYYSILDDTVSLINDFIIDYVLFSFDGNKDIKEYVNDINLINIFESFHDLERDLIYKVHDYINQNNTILYYFYKDKEIISKVLKTKYGHVKSIELDKGDVHEGVTVAIVHCDDGDLVFKPQRYNQYLILEKIVVILKKYMKFNYVIPKCVFFKDHSWVEHIKEINPPDSGVNKLFYRMGVFETIFYMLGSTDMHYENCIINRYNPVFVDLETLCGHNCERSVLNTEITPINYRKSIKYCTSIIFNPDIMFEFVNNQTIDYDYKNKLIIKDNIEKKVSINKIYETLYGNNLNLESFLNGFKDSYNVILEHKNEIKNNIEIISKKEKFLFRTVIRNTALYYTFLQNMRGIDSRVNNYSNKILKIFEKNSSNIDNRILMDELDALKKGYIPSYYFNFTDKSLYTKQGRKIVEKYFSKTMYEQLNENIDSTCDSDLEIQMRILRLSFFKTHLADKEHADEIVQVLDKIKEVYYKFFKDKESKLTCLNINKNDYEIGDLECDIFNSIGLIICLCFYSCKLKDHSLNKIAVDLLNSFIGEDNLESQNEENIFSIYVAYNYVQSKGDKLKSLDFDNFINTSDYYIENFNDENVAEYILQNKKNTNISFKLSVEGAYTFSPIFSGLMNKFISEVKNDKQKF